MRSLCRHPARSVSWTTPFQLLTNSSPRAWERVHRNTIENLFRGLNLEAPLWPLESSGEGTDVS
jgi:hypothetical protein